MHSLKGDVTVLKEDVSSLKGDVAALKMDMSAVKGDVVTLKGEMSDVKGAVRRIALQAVETRTHMDSQFSALRQDMRDMSSRITNQIDGYMAQVGKIDRAQIISDWRVSQLEKRVDSIESRPS
jgi:hypothetical protein